VGQAPPSQGLVKGRRACQKQKVMQVSNYRHFLVFDGCGRLSAIFLVAFLNSPCYETPKTATNKIEQNKPGGKKQPHFL
jgi:hypothetical protein